MGAIAALTINDGQTTPVAHTFNPKVNGNVFGFIDNASGIPVGYPSITHEVREGKQAGSADSVIVNLLVPTVATVDGENVRTRFQSVSVRFNFSKDSTSAERKDAVAYTLNYLGHATVKPMIYNLENWW